MDHFSGKVALVTGGGRGFGRAFALALARNGMRVAVAARSGPELQELVQLIRSKGHEAIAVVADITGQSAVAAMVDTVEAEFGAIDLLINNAGAGKPYGPTWTTQPDEWWRNIETNLKGPLLCTHAVLQGMVQRRSGRIINVASAAGTGSIPYMSAYVTAKTALIRFTEVLADEVRDHGVSVFVIHPGTVRTALAEELIRSEEGQRWLPWFERMFGEGQQDSVDSAADLVMYLASGRADQLSGRYFSAQVDPAELMRQADVIQARALQVLRVSSIA
jgi:NAD(P)-dependent dehydrogenase (short-subunit alcohol dehydrogenase family)